MTASTGPYKNPVSVLVLIYTSDLQVLLLERAAHPGFWQSVTGSSDFGEPLPDTALREVAEETGIQATPMELVDWRLSNRYEIFSEWRHRYAAGTTHNVEHVFSLGLPEAAPVAVAPAEHSAALWLPWREAADKVFSWTNRDAILMLPHLLRHDRFVGRHPGAGPYR